MYRSIRQRMAALDQRLLSPDRYVPYALEVYTHEGELLYRVGGCLDKTTQRYVERPCEAQRVTLKPDQEKIGRAIAQYVAQRQRQDDARKALIMAIGERGGGKTFLGSLLIVTIALMLIGSWSMAVSIFSGQNEELKVGIRKICGPGWFTEVVDPKAPRLQFINGSCCRWFTSRQPKQLRQAQIDWELVVVNEGQDQPEEIITNAVAVVRNKGGLTFVATNPPMEDDGDWVAILHQGLQADASDGESYEVGASQNDSVNQPSREKSVRLMALINPERAAADGLGRVKLSGDIGYQGFTRAPRLVAPDGSWLSGHIAERALDWVDVTRQITAEHAKSQIGFDYIAGCDFQTDPGCCAAVAKLYLTQNGKGPLLLYVVEFVATQGVESDLTLALTSRGYFPGSVDYEERLASSCLLVGDATGSRQAATHNKRDPYSFKQVQADGWKTLPPFYYGKQRTPWNPLIPDSRKQMKLLLSSGALAFSPACGEPIEGFPSLLDSMQRAKVNAVGKFIKKKHYTHGPDGVRYMAWRFLQRPTAPQPTGIDMDSFNALKSTRLGWGR